MRNNQQKRMRSRNNNNNRRGQNPLTRVYESNGPDVKVRGTAQHIAEKYLQLARDAQASSDPVAAENYLQHAEHYFRIIAAAQAQFGVPGQPFQRPDEEDDDFEGDETQGFEAPQPYSREPQNQREGQREFQPRDYGQRDQQPYRDNNQPRRDRERNNQDRPYREQREGGERQPREFRDQREGGERPPRENRWQSREQRRENREPVEAAAPYRDPGQQPQPSLGPDVEAEIGLPSFITQGGSLPAPAVPAAAPEVPVAVTVAAPAPEPVAAVEPPAAAPEAVAAEAGTPEAEGDAKPRARRRRYRRTERAEDGTEAAPAAPAEAGE